MGRAGIRQFCPRKGHQNIPFRGQDYMIPYMVGKLAPNPTHFTRGFVKYVPVRGYFRAVSSQNGDKFVTSPPPPPQSLNDSSRQSTLGQHVPHDSGRPRPPISDRGIIFWRYTIEHDLKGLMERLVRLLVSSDLERDGVVAIPSLFCTEVSYVPRTDNPVGPQSPLEYIVHMRRTASSL